jgi:hypothetical protein
MSRVILEPFISMKKVKTPAFQAGRFHLQPSCWYCEGPQVHLRGSDRMDYRYGSHTVYKIEYHFVWVTKYRYKVLQAVVVKEDVASVRLRFV